MLETILEASCVSTRGAPIDVCCDDDGVSALVAVCDECLCTLAMYPKVDPGTQRPIPTQAYLCRVLAVLVES